MLSILDYFFVYIVKKNFISQCQSPLWFVFRWLNVESQSKCKTNWQRISISMESIRAVTHLVRWKFLSLAICRSLRLTESIFIHFSILVWLHPNFNITYRLSSLNAEALLLDSIFVGLSKLSELNLFVVSTVSCYNFALCLQNVGTNGKTEPNVCVQQPYSWRGTFFIQQKWKRARVNKRALVYV